MAGELVSLGRVAGISYPSWEEGLAEGRHRGDERGRAGAKGTPEAAVATATQARRVGLHHGRRR